MKNDTNEHCTQVTKCERECDECIQKRNEKFIDLALFTFAGLTFFYWLVFDLSRVVGAN